MGQGGGGRVGIRLGQCPTWAAGWSTAGSKDWVFGGGQVRGSPWGRGMGEADTLA